MVINSGGWDGMGWDGMGWDGMGLDGMGLDGIGQGVEIKRKQNLDDKIKGEE